MSFSNNMENTTLQDIVARYPTMYLALSSTDPGEDGAGITEPVIGGYVRQLVGPMTVTGSVATNNNPIIFPKATEDQGTVSYVALFTAESGGTILGSQEIAPVAIEVNVKIVVPSGTSILTMD
ncbi:hypothetical protein M0R72_08720 [Candidatus Pacearchaeota archaeon]|jgi:hypothetical protein|nr:hypothetical protein [Candidatus Pacearchaeota archaeon]